MDRRILFAVVLVLRSTVAHIAHGFVQRFLAVAAGLGLAPAIANRCVLFRVLCENSRDPLVYYRKSMK